MVQAQFDSPARVHRVQCAEFQFIWTYKLLPCTCCQHYGLYCVYSRILMRILWSRDHNAYAEARSPFSLSRGQHGWRRQWCVGLCAVTHCFLCIHSMTSDQISGVWAAHGAYSAASNCEIAGMQTVHHGSLLPVHAAWLAIAESWLTCSYHLSSVFRTSKILHVEQTQCIPAGQFVCIARFYCSHAVHTNCKPRPPHRRFHDCVALG